MLEEMGFCPGVENYSRHLTGGVPGEPPTLINFFGMIFYSSLMNLTLPFLKLEECIEEIERENESC